MVYTYKIPFVGNYSYFFFFEKKANYSYFTLRFLALLHPTFLLNLRKVKNKRELINKIKEEEEEEEEEEEMFIK
ncbi:unnamed protein product [Brassica rapa subsp. trilocularis]